LKFLIATRNEGKKREILAMVEDSIFHFLTLNDFPELGDVEEDGKTFEDNAKKKALHYFKATKVPTVSDDSGLVVDALNGAPGIYSARYSGVHGDDASNNRLLIEQMKDMTNRKATFVCVCVVVFAEDDIHVFRGEFHGRIAQTPRGIGGFGYDPLFLIDGSDKTSAELSNEEKNAISHRAIAVRSMIDFLKRRFRSENG